ncbi:MAG: hypothetical protein QM778_36685 [Myxococcales bacterium]
MGSAWWRLLLGAYLVSGVQGCASEFTPRDYGDPTSLSTPTEEGGLYAWVEHPKLSETFEGAVPEFVVAAYSEAEPRLPLRVFIGRLEKDATGVDQAVDMRPAASEGEPGPDQRFRLKVPLTHGTNRLLIRVETEDQTRVRRLVYALEYRGEAPGLRISVRRPSQAAVDRGNPCSETSELRDAVTSVKQVCVTGQVSTSSGKIAGAEVFLGLADGPRMSPQLDANGAFALPLTLAENVENTIEVEARDPDQRSTMAQFVVTQDSTPPLLEVTSSARETTAASLEVEGTASDPSGIEQVEIQAADGALLELGALSPWKANLLLAQGINAFEVVARDRAGNENRVDLSLTRQRMLWLGEPRRNAGETQIEMDRFNLEDLLDEADQKSLSVVQVDLKPSIKQALERIREPERFGVDTSAWGSAEKNLQRILNMTPDTADLSGTSIEDLLNVANAVGLPSPRILSQLLGRGITDFIVDPDVAADVLTEKLIGTHPNIQQDANGAYVIDISLYDVLQNLTTLAPRFGPAGAHPGFLDGQSYSEVLESGFLLSLPVHSNLVQYDAVDLSRSSKDFFFLLNGDRVLDFNVLEDQFSVVGLKDEPTVNLRIRLKEAPGAMLKGGTNRYASPDAAHPGFYRGNSQGYAVSPWFFEHATVEIGYRMFFDAYANTSYKHELHYDAGSIKDAAVIGWDHGWVHVETAGNIGNVPPDIYAWDLLMEVAQVRLHDNGVAEGMADMAFTLNDLSIGLTADQLVEKLRPRLAEQETKLSELFVGDLGLAASSADFFYEPVDGADGVLLFRAAGDSEGAYAYPTPGFFGDAALTQKVSTLAPLGGANDSTHEKVPATVGAKYYAADEKGEPFQIEIVQRDGNRVGVQVSPAGVLQ